MNVLFRFLNNFKKIRYMIYKRFLIILQAYYKDKKKYLIKRSLILFILIFICQINGGVYNNNINVFK